MQKSCVLFIIWKRDRVLAPEPREGRNVAQQKRNKKGRKEKTDRQKKKKKKKNRTKPNREWKENGKAKEKKEKAKKTLFKRREGESASRPGELAVDVMTSLSFSLYFDSIE